jgi:5'-nucleotidase
MRILITNDDGIHAPGLRALVNAAVRFGEVVVVAPDRERSACSHAMTMREPLRVNSVSYPGAKGYEVNGLPVDCVNVGLTIAFPDGCDLVLSGINNGPNLGFDITYSGTAAGAMEGTINGIRSISISMPLLDYGQPIDYTLAESWLGENLAELVAHPLPALSFWNVNVPNQEPIGHKYTTMGKRIYKDRVEMREDPWGRPYYWQGGTAVLTDHAPGTDVAAIMDGYVSVTPISLDWTDQASLDILKS